MKLLQIVTEPTGIGTEVQDFAYMFDGEKVYKIKVRDGQELESAKEPLKPSV